jgi:hypothetical protein
VEPLEQGVLLVAIAAAAVLELFFILRAVHELRSAQVYQRLVEEIRRLEQR